MSEEDEEARDPILTMKSSSSSSWYIKKYLQYKLSELQAATKNVSKGVTIAKYEVKLVWIS
jgi:hypothetical protein